MLGTSLGIVERGNTYVAIDKTSFGNPISESISNASNTFYTGKPYIDGLGYAFLFRNYRPDLGKWPSQDPIGYPDGWNNFAYCGNRVLQFIDFLGCIVTDTFSSIIEAALDWGKTYNDPSITSQLEHGSAIYKVDDGYKYTVPNIGTETSVIPSPAPNGTEQVATIHSHGAYDPAHPGHDFSEADISSANKSGLPEYLATPDGRLIEYDPKTKKKTVISNKLPYDPKDPKPVNPEHPNYKE